MYKNKNLIIAHRGIHDNKKIPENSLLAFSLALKEKLPIEIDIQLTKDNVPIVFHDPTTSRMTNVNVAIESLTLKEIKQLHLLDTNELIPTLDEVLSLINNQVLLDIELKPTKRKKELITATLEHLKNYSGETLLKSFDPKIVKSLKKTNSTYPCGLLIPYKYPNKFSKFLTNTNLLFAYCNPDFLAISKKLVGNKNIKSYSKKHPIFIWTIKSKEELSKYKNTNFSFICNNLPYKKG